MGVYSIKELEKLSGIKAHTIRIWEQRYAILTPHRSETNIRSYDDKQLKHLLNVALLSKHGHKISKISKLDEQAFSEALQKIYDQTLRTDSEEQLDLEANDLLVAMIDLDAIKFERIYNYSIQLHGFEDTILKLIYPFLEKVGILWTLDQVNPAQEHFISNLIRQKVITAIDKLPESENGKKFILCLPEGEFHELGLLVASYLLKNRGCRIYYLGQNVPFADVAGAVQVINPDYTLCFFVGDHSINQAPKIVESLSDAVGKTELLIASRPFEGVEEIQQKNIHFLHQVSDLELFS